MFKIDCHSHYFEPDIVEGISKILKKYGVKERESIAVRSKREFLSADERLRKMDENEVDMTTIEYQIIWQHYDPSRHPNVIRVELARFINDRLAAVQKQHPDRFLMMADMPLNDIDASIKEVRRVAGLGAKGIRLNTSFNGKPLTAPEFQPFWSEVNKAGLPVTLHPNSLLTPKRTMHNPAYHAVVGYPCDTTVAGFDFLMDDFFAKHPKVKIMLSHSGGALPFIKKRLDAVRMVGGEPPLQMSKSLNKFYYDTAISFDEQILFTIKEVGLDKVCWGSDYPYWPFREEVDIIEGLSLSNTEKAKIFSGNPKKFFGLK